MTAALAQATSQFDKVWQAFTLILIVFCLTVGALMYVNSVLKHRYGIDKMKNKREKKRSATPDPWSESARRLRGEPGDSAPSGEASDEHR